MFNSSTWIHFQVYKYIISLSFKKNKHCCFVHSSASFFNIKVYDHRYLKISLREVGQGLHVKMGSIYNPKHFKGCIVPLIEGIEYNVRKPSRNIQ